jgi:hypothetical protein
MGTHRARSASECLQHALASHSGTNRRCYALPHIHVFPHYLRSVLRPVGVKPDYPAPRGVRKPDTDRMSQCRVSVYTVGRDVGADGLG